MAKAWGRSYETVRRFVDLLNAENMLETGTVTGSVKSGGDLGDAGAYGLWTRAHRGIEEGDFGKTYIDRAGRNCNCKQLGGGAGI